MEDKYAVKSLGATTEIKGPNNSFYYFKLSDLARAVPLPQPVEAAPEQAAKRPRLPEAEADGAAAESGQSGAAAEGSARAMPPGRFEGRVKWFSREKGFGKIEPVLTNNGQAADDVFLHRNQMEGGPDGPHAQAIAEGVMVTYEVTTHYDGKPCACKIQVRDVVRAMPGADSAEAVSQRAELIRRLLNTGLQSGSFQVRGVGKANMEDRFLVRSGHTVESLGSACKKALVSFFGVFDGHSGASCSDFVSTNLDRSLFDCLRHQSRRDVNSELAVKSALLAAFRTTEHNYFQYLNKLEGGAAYAWATAGSTACSAAFYGPDEHGSLRLAVANAGDSRVVLGRRDGTAVRLSEDHTPDVPGERRRIEQEGSAVVNAQGIWRIVLPSKRGLGIAGLSVSRGFGDLEYKQPAGVVSAVPDVMIRTVDLREESFIVFASDGVWGPVSDADAVRIVSAGLREGGGDPAALAAQQLVEEAHRRDGNDDKTALVVWFGDLPVAPTPVASIPTQAAVTRMQPRQVMMAAGQAPGSDDMFAVRQPKTKAEPQADMSDLDDLFSTYARDMGVR
eukprot:CAMPEP_0198592442 /NCGR_PEP_ID=MMETSP1462-20131121/138139_1 /TAXON_ID=1333877 /ORGANISM="Brandtodinium nutriculum, Strain RCC3387" /LENGTH=561 /DNA_ID=CAMNT_0044324021 /DNA_START=30 /DNA_END=1712 /DNA_ORIENTATION=+